MLLDQAALGIGEQTGVNEYKEMSRMVKDSLLGLPGRVPMTFNNCFKVGHWQKSGRKKKAPKITLGTIFMLLL